MKVEAATRRRSPSFVGFGRWPLLDAKGILAAYYWIRASQVEAPGNLVGSAMIGGSVRVNTNPLVEFARESGRASGTVDQRLRRRRPEST